MNRHRRSWLLLLAMGWGPSWALAQPAMPLAVVKLVSFSCSVCRASEVQDAPLAAAAQRLGAQYVVAPVPNREGTARERTYYATRDLYPQHEAAVRAVLYKGAQDLGYPFTTTAEVVDWLRTALPTLALDWARVTQMAEGRAAQQSVDRAIRLALRSGAQEVPTYLVLRGAEIAAALDLPGSGKVNLLGLREAVLAKLTEVAQ